MKKKKTKIPRCVTKNDFAWIYRLIMADEEEATSALVRWWMSSINHRTIFLARGQAIAAVMDTFDVKQESSIGRAIMKMRREIDQKLASSSLAE